MAGSCGGSNAAATGLDRRVRYYPKSCSQRRRTRPELPQLLDDLDAATLALPLPPSARTESSNPDPDADMSLPSIGSTRKTMGRHSRQPVG
ncbi:MAG TPA: hypothetical protein VK771_09320 [Acidimicrobiia bacterium]|nr:hypothetical protein [Acidimicrobiia bacterium]